MPDTSDTIDSIKKRMKDLETLIEETKERLPAHSTKPPVMMDLLEYEDEYDILQKKLEHLKNDKS
jgi:prefoldin subunit 5